MATKNYGYYGQIMVAIENNLKIMAWFQSMWSEIWQFSSVLKLTQLSDVRMKHLHKSNWQGTNMANKAITDNCQSDNADLSRGTKVWYNEWKTDLTDRQTMLSQPTVTTSTIIK